MDYACDVDIYSNDWVFTGVGKLASGVTLSQATAAVGPIWRAVLERASTQTLAGKSIRLSDVPNFALPYDRTRIGAGRLAVLASSLAAVVIAVTLANLTGLLMIRVLRRRSADATRVALGGSPWLASRAVGIEAILVGVVAALLALAILQMTGRLLTALVPWPAGTPALSVFRLSTDLVLMIAMSGLGFGTLAAILPAYCCRPTTLTNDLTSRSAQTPRVRSQALVIIPQVALTTAVMMIAAPVGISAMRDELAGPGYDLDKLTYARFISPSPARCHQTTLAWQGAWAERRLTQERILANLAQVGSVSAALSSGTPF